MMEVHYFDIKRTIFRHEKIKLDGEVILGRNNLDKRDVFLAVSRHHLKLKIESDNVTNRKKLMVRTKSIL